MSKRDPDSLSDEGQVLLTKKNLAIGAVLFVAAWVFMIYTLTGGKRAPFAPAQEDAVSDQDTIANLSASNMVAPPVYYAKKKEWSM